MVQTGFGHRLDCAVPRRVFSRVQGLPRVIGFDVALISRDEDGKGQFRLIWTGRSGQEKQPRNFGKLVLV